jgi:hypothetical protein
MKVKDLREVLSHFSDNMEVIIGLNDYDCDIKEFNLVQNRKVLQEHNKSKILLNALEILPSKVDHEELDKSLINCWLNSNSWDEFDESIEQED